MNARWSETFTDVGDVKVFDERSHLSHSIATNA